MYHTSWKGSAKNYFICDIKLKNGRFLEFRLHSMLRVEYNCKENNYKEIVYATFRIFHVNLECVAFGDEICFSSFADAFAIEWKKILFFLAANGPPNINHYSAPSQWIIVK